MLSDAGKIMDADIPEKLAQLKGQIATLEKREERWMVDKHTKVLWVHQVQKMLNEQIIQIQGGFCGENFSF